LIDRRSRKPSLVQQPSIGAIGGLQPGRFRALGERKRSFVQMSQAGNYALAFQPFSAVYCIRRPALEHQFEFQSWPLRDADEDCGADIEAPQP
jgi:hypothetical protein